MESNAIEERVELSMLYDFYGALLKENQQRMFEACILDDYGYTEIAEEEGISRSGSPPAPALCPREQSLPSSSTPAAPRPCSSCLSI